MKWHFYHPVMVIKRTMGHYRVLRPSLVFLRKRWSKLVRSTTVELFWSEHAFPDPQTPTSCRKSPVCSLQAIGHLLSDYYSFSENFSSTLATKIPCYTHLCFSNVTQASAVPFCVLKIALLYCEISESCMPLGASLSFMVYDGQCKFCLLHDDSQFLVD